MRTSIFNAGNIELSGKVIIADPGFDRGEKYIAKDVAVKPGTYAAYIAKKYVNGWGTRVASIMAIHTDYIGVIQDRWDSYGFIVADGGQCGIFDDVAYPALGAPSGEPGDEKSFYGECSKIRLSRKQGGILRSGNGVVSASGYGDGFYEVFCQYYEGERIALMVDFYIANAVTITRKIRTSL